MDPRACAEEHRSESHAFEDFNLPHLGEHLHFCEVRFFAGALVGSELEEPRPFRRRRSRHDDSRELRKCRQHRVLLVYIGGIGGCRVQVRRRGALIRLVCLQLALQAPQRVERWKRREHEHRRTRNAGDDLEDADGRMPDSIERRYGGVLKVLCQPTRRRAIPQDVLAPQVVTREELSGSPGLVRPPHRIQCQRPSLRPASMP